MKRFMYLLGLVLVLAGVGACTKSNDPEPQPVVGRWELDRIRVSGFRGDFTSYNGDLTPDQLGYQSDVFTIKQDNTFTGTIRAFGRVQDYKGTWAFATNQLTLTYDGGDTENYSFDTSNPTQLAAQAATVRDTLANPRTNAREVVSFTLQMLYAKDQ